ncbi:MAG TPA: ATP-binding protein [Rhodocyclaceae bacterium]
MSIDIEQKVSRQAEKKPTPWSRWALGSRGTLNRKGIVTLAILIAYFVLVTLVIAYERRILIDSVDQLTEVHQQEEHQVALNIQVARAILTVNENYFSPNVDVSSKILALEIEAVLSGLRKLTGQYSMISDDAALLEQGMNQLLEHPSRSTVADIRGVFHRTVIDLDAVTSDIRSRKQKLLEDYQRSHDRITVEWLGFGVVGLGFLAGLMMFFFRKLAEDIRRIQEHATAIVRGHRGEALPNSRHDELGDLIDAVNNMQSELSARELQIELGRQQQFHKEKMAAVGSLAAAVAHEINNPLSAIVGIAQTMVSEQGQRQCQAGGSGCRPEMVLEQARRVMQITRQIGEFSVPQSQEPELIDLNGLVRSTCNFVGFDRRFRRLELIQNFDRDLPAVNAVADHIVQVLMNLLLNAADALDTVSDRPPRITVATHFAGDHVTLAVRDNGAGIPPEILDKVFNEHFTTKAPGKGSGLGLALCRSLINSAGGQVAMDSTPGEGTVVTVTLPLPLANGSQYSNSHDVSLRGAA